MPMHYTLSAKNNCYALIWSYGEICVGCGCCSDDPKIRIPARIDYHKERLEQCLNFDLWSDEPEMREIQEHNLKADIEYHRHKLQELENERRENAIDYDPCEECQERGDEYYQDEDGDWMLRCYDCPFWDL